MTKIRIAKIAGMAAGVTLVFGSFVPMVGAVTIAELQAQINALMAQLATLQGGSMVSTTTFTQNLTVGSTGAEVTALQQALVAQGHLVMPAGVAMGYFGSLTKAAVAKWQAAKGISPAAGYWGPISRAAANAMVGMPPVPVPGNPGGGITTPGVEGTLTASLNASPASGTKLYAGGSRADVFGIKLEAKLSDMRVERVKLQLSADTSGNSDQQFYTKIANKIYVLDNSTVLASADLDATTVVKESSKYYITLAGFNFVVPKDGIKVLTIALDPKASWDSTYNDDSWKLTVPVDGVRAVDGANINQRSPTTAFSNTFTTPADIVDSTAVTLSLNPASPITNQVIASDGTNDDEMDFLPVAKIDFKVDKGKAKITDLVVDIVRGGTTTTASSTTAYLYDDNNVLVGSATVKGTSATAMSATFSTIDWVVPADTTKSLTVKLYIKTAGLAATTFAADIGVTTAVATNVTSENTAGSSITETGSAQSKTITVRKVGPQVTLVSKSIATNGVPQGNPAAGLTSTSTITATFNIKVKAIGGTLTFGNVASVTPLFASSTASFKVYRNGTYDGTISSNATSTSYQIPNGCVAETAAKNGCTLTDGAEVTVPVTFIIQGRTVAGAALTAGSVYSIGFEGIQWYNASSGATQTTTFMGGELDWRTADVSFP